MWSAVKNPRSPGITAMPCPTLSPYLAMGLMPMAPSGTMDILAQRSTESPRPLLKKIQPSTFKDLSDFIKSFTNQQHPIQEVEGTPPHPDPGKEGFLKAGKRL